jgi:hypothetical protein
MDCIPGSRIPGETAPVSAVARKREPGLVIVTPAGIEFLETPEINFGQSRIMLERRTLQRIQAGS